MSVSLYQVSVPVFTRFLNNLSAVLETAAAHAEQKRVEPAVLLGSRLYPDMFALSKQVIRTADAAVGGAARLAGLEVPTFEANPDSFPGLVNYLKQAVEFLATLTAAQIDGQEERVITLKRGNDTRTVQGQQHLLNNVLPNFYFHLTTAYGILRHNGVEIGKQDFLGRA
ncbi:DUF1993 domain-containing protein [Janthinobacterium sp. 17J80-10]|uniref:DUF1993 domain-containing protein n=1 Tax=Janthinobacterium sp. 17J80-10 TaxID=2497863 RepID=UPI0010052851|nr:DUF1993 domain-containing protein [Janthinobacterium sp. 17J80-10]QAU33985.1 DUF1993 domain-containing protein [Janthinobacterium sp. 17J80-10]